ncbi:SpoIIE family protein phosphatase [Streptomyces sp. NPDC004008]
MRGLRPFASPWALSGNGSHDIRRLPGGPVLGILPDADCPRETFTLDKDTALVMVTDGVVEAPDLSLDTGLDQTGTLAARALHEGLDAEETADQVLDAAIAMNRSQVGRLRATSSAI